jgi:hypothetical protein
MRSVAAALVLFLVSTTAAHAADAVDHDVMAPTAATITHDGNRPLRVETGVRVVADERPAALVSLYAGFAALQAYDIYSTSAALARGGREGNPLMVGVAGHPAAFIAVDAATTGLSIYAAERLWRHHHRAKAVALMAISNGVMAVVAAHNASVLRGLP